MTIYRRLLRLAAPALAREYGAAMEETLAARLRAATGRRSRTRIVAREFSMLFALAWSERFGARARQQLSLQRALARREVGAMDTLGQEIRQAARRLWRSPAFTAASILTLALAIGANAAIFAVVERVVINPLPYPESDRLVEIDHGSVTLKVQSGMGTTSGIYFIYKHRSQSIQSAAVHQTKERTLVGRGDPERISVTSATPSLEQVLRVRPVIGRWFTEEEGRPSGRPVAVLSDGLWTRRFGRNPAVVGEAIVLDGQPAEVVGVMPPGFAFPFAGVDAWMPAQVSDTQGFGLFEFAGIARLRDGVTLETARTELQGLLGTIAEAYPQDPRAAGNLRTRLTFTGITLKEFTLGGISRALWMLLGAVGVVMLVAGANVANLFLVRTELRQREVAIRRALGAARAGLGRYFFTESALLALAGGTLGLFLAWGALRLLVTLGPSTLPRLHEIQLEPVTIAYVLLLSVIAAIVFGSIPLLRGSSAAALHESGRGNTASRQRHRVRHLLLGGQVAMALVLMVASGLMVRTFLNLRAIDPGYNPESTLTFSVGLPPNKYPVIDSAVAAHRALLDRILTLPGVTAVSATTCLPLANGCSGNTLLVEGQAYPPGTLPPLAMFRAVAGNYFETMGMRVLRGRSVTRADVDRHEPVAVISDALARSAFRDQDPIGKRVASNQPPPKPGVRAELVWLTIVGVVANTPLRAMNEPAPMPMLFMPLSLARGADVPQSVRIAPGANTLNYVVRTAGAPLDLVASARQAVQSIDPDLALAQVTTLQDMVDRASAQMTFTMVLLAIAASVALILGVIGIYGVTSYVVSQRTSEIGVRLALGAEPGGITGQIVTQGGVIAIAGIAVGLATAYAGSQLMASVLYGVSPRDPVVFGGTAVTLQAVALLACWLPARRAARLSPTIALRAD